MPFIFKVPPSSYKSTILNDSPIAYWRLGELSGVTAIDEIAGSNGTYVNTPTLGATGLIANDNNKAVFFNRINTEKMVIPDDNKFTFANATNDLPFSFEAWVSISSFATPNPIFSKIENTVTFLEEYLFQVDSDGSLDCVVYDQISSNNHSWKAAIGSISLNTTSHVVVTYNAAINTGKMYVNGIEKSVTFGNSGSYVRMRNLSRNISIGSRIDDDVTFKAFFDGTIDEVAIYNYVLTPAQVLAHYNAGT